MISVLSLEADPQVIEAASLVRDALTDSPGMRLNASSPTVETIWTNLRNEVHQLVCTESSKYREERTLLKVTYKPAAAALAAYLTHGFGVPVASASALASLALLLPVKMTISAWCQAVKSSKGNVKSGELAALHEIASQQPQ